MTATLEIGQTSGVARVLLDVDGSERWTSVEV
jgi:hypothetical protein